jgi:predicted acylesterase/phospholipase RssA
MEKFLKKEFKDTTIKRDLNLGIVDVKDGSYKDFTAQNITEGDNLVDALYASLSFAGFFPPADVLGSSYFDGSAVWDVDIFSAVNKCKDKGFKEEDIVVDVVLTSAANLKKVEADDYKSISMLFRYLEVSSFYNSMDGLLRAKFAYQGVDFRYVIAPSGNIPSSLHPLNLSEKQIKTTFDMGVKDAQEAIEKGAKTTFDELIHYHALKKQGDQRILKHTYGSFQEANAKGDFGEYNILEDDFMRKYTYKMIQK